MLNFRNTNIVFVILLLVLIATSFYHVTPWWTLIVLFFLYSLVLFYGSYYVGSNFFMKMIIEGSGVEKKIALSFDDGPVKGMTDRVLHILETEGVPASFFCIGSRIEGNEMLLKEINIKGHLIGNHSFSHHFWFDLFPKEKMLADVEDANEAIEKTIAKKPAFFRPPYGVTTPVMQKVLQQAGLTPIGWNIRSMDTMIKDQEKLFNKVTKALKPGAILLFHDHCESTIGILPRLIDHARREGYEFVRIDELINKKAYV
jgi:peptidoglycan/xylan/chitin deacetylase (PgdA/CDA1 family)